MIVALASLLTGSSAEAAACSALDLSGPDAADVARSCVAARALPALPWFEGRGHVNVLQSTPLADEHDDAIAQPRSTTPIVHRVASELHGFFQNASILLPLGDLGSFPSALHVDDHVCIDVPTGSAAARAYSRGMAAAPLRGLLLPSLPRAVLEDGCAWTLRVPSTLLDESDCDASSSAEHSASISCIIAGARRGFANVADAAAAVERELALAVAQHARLLGNPPTRALRRALGARDAESVWAAAAQARAAANDWRRRLLDGDARNVVRATGLAPGGTHAGVDAADADADAEAAAAAAVAPTHRVPSRRWRSLYIAPTTSLGVRSVLAVRYIFSSQLASDAKSAVDVAAALDAGLSALQNASFGSASFPVTLLPDVITLPASVATCAGSSALPAALAAAIAAGTSPSVNVSSYSHFVMWHPTPCAYGYSGLGSCPGRNVWMSSLKATTLVHELGHNLGLQHSSFDDPITGAHTEYYDDEDPMGDGSSIDNVDYNAGYKHDQGWISDSRVVTVGPVSVGGWQSVSGGAFTLAPSDGGRLSRNSALPLSVRLPHPGATFLGDRWYYASFRSRSLQQPMGVTINDLGLNGGTAGNAFTLDSGVATTTQADAGLSVGQACVLPSINGSAYLWETAGYVRVPPSSTDAGDGTLSVRLSPLALPPGVSAPGAGAVTATPLGCYGVACQPEPIPTPVKVMCAGNGTGGGVFAVPVNELGYPVVYALSDSSASASSSTAYAGAVSATLCVPAGVSLSAVNISLSGYDALPLAEMLTTSSLSRGNAPYASSPLFAPPRGFNRSCLTLALLAPAGVTRFIAAAARWMGAPLPSAAAAPAPAMLNITCAAAAPGAASTLYGMPSLTYADDALVLTFSSSSYGGLWYVSPAAPFSAGGLTQYDNAARTYSLRWVSGKWYLYVFGSVSSFYRTQNDAAGTQLTALPSTAFGGSFSVARVCPAHAWPSGSGASLGCVSCPPGAFARGGAASSSVLGACSCGAGTYLNLGVDGRYACAPCAAGTYAQLPGQTSASDCLPCQLGFTSAAGAAACAKASNVTTASGGSASASVYSVAACASIRVSGFASAWNGVWLPNASLPASTAGSGRGIASFYNPARRGYYLVANGEPTISDSTSSFTSPGAMTWTIGADALAASYFTPIITSARPPHFWTSAAEFSGYAAAAAVCTCAPGASTYATGCVCPAGQIVSGAAGACAPNATNATATATCASGNGGCSDICADAAANGGVRCSCAAAGWGLRADNATCARCGDGFFVAATGACAPCPAAASSPARTAGTGTACGCPYGFVLLATGACRPPSDVEIDVAAGGNTASPIRGRYVACAPIESGSGGGGGGGRLVWRLLTSAAGAAAADAIYLIYNPSTFTWALQAGGDGALSASGYALPLYAFIVAPAGGLDVSPTWPASVQYGAAGAPVSVLAATAGMLPAGAQSWSVFAPWPASFTSTMLIVNASATASAAASSLPACAALTAVSAASAASAAGASTLGFGSAIIAGAGAASPTASPSLASATSSPQTVTPSSTPSSTAAAATASRTGTTSASSNSTASVSPTATVSATTFSQTVTPSSTPSSTAAAATATRTGTTSASSNSTASVSQTETVSAAATPSSLPQSATPSNSPSGTAAAAAATATSSGTTSASGNSTAPASVSATRPATAPATATSSLTPLTSLVPLPTYVPPPGAASFMLTAVVCGLGQDAVVDGLADDAAPLGIALRKFSACAAAAVQPAVNSSITFLAVTLVAAPGAAAKEPVALPGGAVVAAAADCNAWQARAARVSARSRRRRLQQSPASSICTEISARVTARAPAAAALASMLASPASPGAHASALSVLLEPAAAVNTAAATLAAFFGALRAGNALAVPALSSLYASLGAELAGVPAPSAAAASSSRRELAAAANASGATIAILFVSTVALISSNRIEMLAPPPSSGNANGAVIGGIAGGVIVTLLFAGIAAAAVARQRRSRSAAAKTILFVSQNPLPLPKQDAGPAGAGTGAGAGAATRGRSNRSAIGASGGDDYDEARICVFPPTALRRATISLVAEPASGALPAAVDAPGVTSSPLASGALAHRSPAAASRLSMQGDLADGAAAAEVAAPSSAATLSAAATVTGAPNAPLVACADTAANESAAVSVERRAATECENKAAEEDK
jgi:hypothetical protein